MSEPGSWGMCQRYARHELRLEVNHKAPLLGAYRSVSCGNHQADLEVLCHACHLIATSVQRSDRRTTEAAICVRG